jgi:hypothetical protein
MPFRTRSSKTTSEQVATATLTPPVDVGAEQAKEVPVGDVLGEGQRAFIVPLPWAGARIPPDRGVSGLPVVGLQDRTDQDRRADRAGRPIDLRPGIRVAQWVDVGGVLRPDHQIRLGVPACGDLGRQPSGARCVVVQHSAPLGVEI